jgi:KaiC/GvpD/RAD55 family RecA-like ATPase
VYRDFSKQLNAVCEAGGRGTASWIAEHGGFTHGQISKWRKNVRIHPDRVSRIVAAIEAAWSKSNGTAHSTNGRTAALPTGGTDTDTHATSGDRHLLNGHAPPPPFDFNGAAEAGATAAKTHAPFVVRSFPELATLKGATRDMVVALWLPLQTMAMIYGWRGTGKSLFALSLAMHIAAGRDFLGWSIESARSVAYVDGELSPADLLERYRHLVRVLGFEPPSERLRLISMMDPEQPVRLNLADSSHHERIATAIGDADVLFFDSSVSLWQGKEVEAWSIVQPFMLEMRRRGKTVIFLHQAGKDGAQRGLSDYEDLLETSIELALPRGGAANGAAFCLTFKKHRGFFGVDAESKMVELTEEGWSWRSAKARADDMAAKRDGDSDAGDDGHTGRVWELLRGLPVDAWKPVPHGLKLEDGALVVEKRTVQTAYGDVLRDEDGTPPNPGTIRKTVHRALMSLANKERIRVTQVGSKTWISWPAIPAP